MRLPRPRRLTESGNSSVLARRVEIHEETQRQPQSLVGGGWGISTHRSDRSPPPLGTGFRIEASHIRPRGDVEQSALGVTPVWGTQHQAPQKDAGTHSQLGEEPAALSSLTPHVPASQRVSKPLPNANFNGRPFIEHDNTQLGHHQLHVGHTRHGLRVNFKFLPVSRSEAAICNSGHLGRQGR